jgi:hypothetical protein
MLPAIAASAIEQYQRARLPLRASICRPQDRPDQMRVRVDQCDQGSQEEASMHVRPQGSDSGDSGELHETESRIGPFEIKKESKKG